MAIPPDPKPLDDRRYIARKRGGYEPKAEGPPPVFPPLHADSDKYLHMLDLIEKKPEQAATMLAHADALIINLQDIIDQIRKSHTAVIGNYSTLLIELENSKKTELFSRIALIVSGFALGLVLSTVIIFSGGLH